MRDLFRSYNAGKTYGQVRLGKTTHHCPLAGSFNNFPWPRPSPVNVMVLSVDQPAVTRLGKGPLRMFISTMAFTSEEYAKSTPHMEHLMDITGQ